MSCKYFMKCPLRKTQYCIDDVQKYCGKYREFEEDSSRTDALQEDPELSDSMKLILEMGTCCICEKPLAGSKYVNMGMLNKKATWKYPVWGNVLIPGCEGRALFYVCDRCQESSEKGIDPGPVKYAVEVRDKAYILHRVEELEDVPAVTEADIVE